MGEIVRPRVLEQGEVKFMQVLELEECARCGDMTLERLRTHTSCVSCNYAPDIDGQDFYVSIPDVVLQAVAADRSWFVRSRSA